MDTQQCKDKFKNLSERTLLFIIDKDKVLLGVKKRGFGKGNMLGIGGKVENGESIEQAMVREAEEEVGVTPTEAKKVAVLSFYFPEKERPEKWNQRVSVYVTSAWSGTIAESEEIRPEWLMIDEIPFERMWDDSKYWLPRVLNGSVLEGRFVFNNDLLVVDKSIDTAVF